MVNKQDFLQVFQGSGIGKIEDNLTSADPLSYTKNAVCSLDKGSQFDGESTYYTDNEFKCTASANHVGQSNAFPGSVQVNIQGRDQGITETTQVRGGLLCGKAGGHIEEYNWRYCAMHNQSEEDMKYDFLDIIRSRIIKIS